jgi:hypothetical protein
MIIGVILKQPVEVLDYDIDATPMFNNDALDFVDSVTVDITPPAELVITPVIFNNGQDIKLWLSAGNDGTEYKVEVNATSDAGRTKQDEILVNVEDF